jgi:large subunit ribosomal protein L34
MVKLRALVTRVTEVRAHSALFASTLRLSFEHSLFFASPLPHREARLRWIPKFACDILNTAAKTQILFAQQERVTMPKRTFQPNRRHRAKTHGFRARMKSNAGAAVLSRRRAAGRKRVSVSPGHRD